MLFVFDAGKIIYEEYDPEGPIRTNIWTSETLNPLEEGKAEANAVFMERSSKWIPIVDKVWTFERWENEEFRNEIIERSGTKFKWALRYDIDKSDVVMIGDVPQDVRDGIEKAQCGGSRP